MIVSESSWRLGKVPEDWERANVTPVFKKGKKEDPGNYRPVSLNSIPGVAMKQLILEAISKYPGDKKSIRNSPHGFTKAKSWVTNPIAFCHEAAGSAHEAIAVGVCLDVSRAFDAVSHNSLVASLMRCKLEKQTAGCWAQAVVIGGTGPARPGDYILT